MVPLDQAVNIDQPINLDRTNPSAAAAGDIASTDAQLIQNGYQPIAVIDKAAVGDGWTTRPNTIEAVTAERAAHPAAVSTGLRTGELVGVDIDFYKPEHVDAIKRLADEKLGRTPLERVGRKGAILCYRNRTPIRKITVAAVDISTYLPEKWRDGVAVASLGKPAPVKVEILGAGQQFVAYGIHPTTGKPYEWVNACFGGDPLSCKLDDLPEVTPGQLSAFAEAAAKLIGGFQEAGNGMLVMDRVRITGNGARVRQQTEHPSGTTPTGEPVTLEIVRDMLACIDPSCDRDTWMRIIAAIHAAPIPDDDDESERRALAREWSAGGSNFVSYDDVDRVFDDMKPADLDDAEKVHFGTLVDKARAAGYDGPIRIDLPVEERFKEYLKNQTEAKEQAAESTAASEWGEPVDLFAALGKEPVLTRDMLPDSPAVEYAFDVAERQGVEPGMSVVTMLAVCATAIHDDIKVQRKPGHLERAHFNCAVVADSGIGKSPAMDPMIAPLRVAQARHLNVHNLALNAYRVAKKLHEATEKEWLQRHQQARPIGDATLAEIAMNCPLPPEPPKLRQYEINEATKESMRDVLRDNPGGVLNFQDEMAGWFASFDAYHNTKGADQSFWLRTDNGGQYTVNRKGEGLVFIPNLSCCFIGGIQPERLRPLVENLKSDGFLQRIHVIYGAETAAGELEHRPVNAEAQAAYERLITALVAIDPASVDKPILYDWESDNPRREIEAVANALRIWPTTPAHLREHLGKWRGKISRLMLLFHAVECVSRGKPIGKEIGLETAQRVKAFMLHFLLPNAMRFYSEFFRPKDATGEDARWIAGHILAHRLERITLRDICRAHHLDPVKDLYRIDEAMAVLQRANYIGERVDDRAKRATSWPVNPAIHVLYAERAAQEKAKREATRREYDKARARMKREGIG